MFYSLKTYIIITNTKKSNDLEAVFKKGRVQNPSLETLEKSAPDVATHW